MPKNDTNNGLFDANPAAPTTEASQPAPVPIAKPNPFGKLATRPHDYLRAFIAGETGTGKTHLILSMPRPCVVLYAERGSGDVDLRDREDEGIHIVYIDRNKPIESADEAIENIRSGPAKALGIQSISLDSGSHFADWTLGSLNANNRSKGAERVAGGATVRQYGFLVSALKPFFTRLFGMPQHVLITSHLKKEEDSQDMWVDGERVTKKISTWYPKLTPGVAECLLPEVALLGYTWRKEIEGQDDIYGVSFKARSFNRTRELIMQNAKAPAGWGLEMPTDVTAWIRRLEEEKGISMLRAAA